MTRSMMMVLAAGCAASCAWAQPVLELREGADVPRSLTPAERAWLKLHPLAVPEVVTPPPQGSVRTVAEYEPMEGLLMAWEGTTDQNNILTAMAREVTNLPSGGKVFMVVDNATERTRIINTWNNTNAGVNQSRVDFVTRVTDSIWIRDYGPRYIYQGDVRAIVDHTYNRPRPNDDTFPFGFSTRQRHALYELPLIHGGGNYHLDASGDAFATNLIANENPSLTPAQIIAIWRDYQNVETWLSAPFPASVDSTQHIDMWLQSAGNKLVFISDWDANVGSTQWGVCNTAAAHLSGQGYTVFRLPARSIGGVHYTYTNMVVFNDLVMIPRFNNMSETLNQQALATVQAALPGKTVRQIAADSLAFSAGVLHCVVMHVPSNRNGASPGVTFTTLRQGASATPGQTLSLTWASDDDVAVTRIDLFYSHDDGATFLPLASNVPIVQPNTATGRLDWVVPQGIFGPTLLVRARATDASNNTGEDTISLALPTCPSDLDNDGDADLDDFFAFFNAYEAEDPLADVDGNPGVDLGDFFAFFNSYEICV